MIISRGRKQRQGCRGLAWPVTAAPMRAGTLVKIIGLKRVGQSSAAGYAANIFSVVALSLLASWIVATFA